MLNIIEYRRMACVKNMRDIMVDYVYAQAIAKTLVCDPLMQFCGGYAYAAARKMHPELTSVEHDSKWFVAGEDAFRLEYRDMLHTMRRYA